MAKIEVADTMLSVYFEAALCVPEHRAFCLCEVLTRCHRYVTLFHLYFYQFENYPAE